MDIPKTTLSQKIAKYLLDKGCVYSNDLCSVSLICTFLFIVCYSSLLIFSAFTGFSFIPEDNVPFIADGIFMMIPSLLIAVASSLILNGVLANVLSDELNEVRRLHSDKVLVKGR